MPDEIVIIGDGIAGATAAVTARKQDADVRITILTDEPEPLYNRVATKDFCKGKIPEEKLYIHDLAFYDEHQIKLVTHTRVAELQHDAKRVVTSDGGMYAYDKLVLATGGTPRRSPVPGGDSEGIHTFWTVADARRIREHAEKAEHGVVVGAGLLGIDLAVIFGIHNVDTKYVMRGDRWWRQGLTKEGSVIVEKGLQEMGVECVFHDNVKEFRAQEGRVHEAELESGTVIPCDIAGVAIGLRYNNDFLRGTRVKVGEGILTDERMRTSAPDIYACGDVAQYFDILLDRVNQNGSWASAKKQGELVGLNMTGAKNEFRLVDTYSINHFDFMIMSVGNVYGERAIQQVYDGENYRRIFFKGNRAIGAVFVGDVSQAGVIRQVIDKELDLTGREELLLEEKIDRDILKG